jgi:hypothetical protein
MELLCIYAVENYIFTYKVFSPSQTSIAKRCCQHRGVHVQDVYTVLSNVYSISYVVSFLAAKRISHHNMM